MCGREVPLDSKTDKPPAQGDADRSYYIIDVQICSASASIFYLEYSSAQFRQNGYPQQSVLYDGNASAGGGMGDADDAEPAMQTDIMKANAIRSNNLLSSQGSS